MDNKKLAEYIMAISNFKCIRAEDRITLNSYLADSAKILAKIELNLPLENDIDNHEKLWGHTWLIDGNSHEVLYKKWSDFKESLKN
ncbi:MAG TPA: hypothetical protein PLK35_02725 [Candidatus Moranbacteria bacterium]|nr:hypothetical protein [Candidatus Moranbacteria bacterium]